MPTDFGIAGMGRYTPPSVVKKTQSISTPSRSPVYKPTAVKSTASRTTRGGSVRSAPKRPTRMKTRASTPRVPDFQGQAYRRAAPVLRRMGTNPRGGGVIQPVGNATSKAASAFGKATSSAAKSFGDAWAGSNPINILYRQIGERLKNPSGRR